VFENWRSVVAPPGISDVDRQRLVATVDRMVTSTPWHQAVERYRWLDRYLPADDFARFTSDEESRVRDILHKLGTQSVDATARAAAGRYPLFVLAGVVLSALGAVAGAVRSKQQPVGDTLRGAWRPIGLIAIGILLHLLLAERVGFVIASTALFWLTARAFDARHPARDVLFAFVVSAGAYLLFVRLLDVSLPTGILERWL
jgi:hypothetical protein